MPAILSRQRVLISTGTKNLQEQIFFKDIPALRDALGVPFTAAYMKGRANYLCLHRLDQLTGEAQSPAVRAGCTRRDRVGTSEGRARRSTQRRRRRCPTSCSCRSSANGRRAPTRATAPSSRICPKICRSGTRCRRAIETCIGTECPRYDDCFVTRMRQRAAAADLVIVNHHLLCADAAVRQNAYGEVIPACANAILDEAHQLEDVATQYFGVAVSTYRVEDFARDVERAVAHERAQIATISDGVAKVVDRVRDHARDCFTEVAFGASGRRASSGRAEERVRATPTTLLPAADAAAALAGALDALESTLALLGAQSAVPCRAPMPTAADDVESGESEALRRSPDAPGRSGMTSGF